MSERRPVRTPAWLTLASDERVLLRARPSTSLVLAGVASGFLLIIVAAIPFMATGSVIAGRRVSLTLLLAVLAGVVAIFLLIRGREYVLTNRRIVVAVGLRDRAVRTVDLGTVEDVELDQDRWQRWISVGDLRFVVDGEVDLEFELVGNPHLVYERVIERL